MNFTFLISLFVLANLIFIQNSHSQTLGQSFTLQDAINIYGNENIITSKYTHQVGQTIQVKKEKKEIHFYFLKNTNILQGIREHLFADDGEKLFSEIRGQLGQPIKGNNFFCTYPKFKWTIDNQYEGFAVFPRNVSTYYKLVMESSGSHGNRSWSSVTISIEEINKMGYHGRKETVDYGEAKKFLLMQYSSGEDKEVLGTKRNASQCEFF